MAVTAPTIESHGPTSPPVGADPATETTVDSGPGEPGAGDRPDAPADRRRGRRRWAFRGAAALILLAAGVLRLLPIAASLPYPGYVDEGHTLHHGAQMVLDRTMDPGWYDYPTLPVAMSGAVLWLADLPASADKRDQDLEFTAQGGVYDDIRPTRGLVASRVLTALFSVATVGLIMVATARLTRRRVALVAGVVAAVLPALVQRGMFDFVDTMATFFVTAAFVAGLAVVRATRRSRRFGWTIVAGACCGLAVGTKYPNGAALVMVAILVGIVAHGSIAKRVLRVAAAGVAGAVVFLATMPAVLLGPNDVIKGVQRNYDRYAAKAIGPRYWESAILTTEVGVVLLVAAAIGTVVLLRRRGTRLPTVAWLVYSVLIVVVAARLQFQPFRNLLSILPFLCIAMGVGIDWAVRGVAGRVGGGRRVADGAVAGVVAILVLYLAIGGISPYYDSALKPDTRTEAREWLQANVKPGDSVTVMAELAMTKPELDRIPGSVTVVSGVDGSVVRAPASPPDPGGAHYVVSGRLFETLGPWRPEFLMTQVAGFGSRPVEEALNLTRGNTTAVFIFRVP